MLNADWHHGDGHGVGQRPTVGRCCAQRRLASRGRAPPSTAQHGGTSFVLNADWHHGDGHLTMADPTPSFAECSTPIGITGTGTFATFCFPRALRVCSTPIGITGTGTTTRRRGRLGSGSAQRRLASRGRAPTPKTTTPRRRHTCAQRRLASRGRARAQQDAANHTGLWCSTPIGITGTGTIASVAAWLASMKCSTPIGITGTGTIARRHIRKPLRVLNADWHHGDGHRRLC